MPLPASSLDGLSIRLDHASIMTGRLDPAIAFYTDVLGLQLRVREEDPLRKGHQRAMLTDSQGRDVLEIIELPELAHPSVPGRGSIHHLGFRLREAAWQALRARLDASGYDYREVEGRLFVRDADGLVLEVEYD